MINKKNIKKLASFECERIGSRNETVRTVIGEIGKFAIIAESYALGIDDINPFKRITIFKLAEEEFANAEEEKEYRKKKAGEFFDLAGRKILFLNSECRKLTGVGFVNTKVDKESPEELQRLTEAFMDAFNV